MISGQFRFIRYRVPSAGGLALERLRAGLPAAVQYAATSRSAAATSATPGMMAPSCATA